MNAIFPNSLGFNIVLYGLGSKRDLLERFRTTVLQDSIHVVINGFFPGISVKSVSFKNVKRSNIISLPIHTPTLMRMLLLILDHSNFFSLYTSRIAQCLRSYVWTQGSSFESSSLNFLLLCN